MDRINNTGKMLIDYKKELMKHYSVLVDESLKTSLNVLQEKKVLDERTIDAIINDSISLSEFETFVMSKREYLKSTKELISEFEKIRQIVNESLIKNSFTNFVDTESNIDNDTITILRQYSITPEFIKLFFGIADEEMEIIMKKRGFAEKFAVLRISKVFKEILSEMRVETEYSQGFSKVYYNASIEGFSVDYRYHINVNSITSENIDNKIKKIRDADRVVERKFAKKTGLSFYNIKPLEPTKEPLKIIPKNKTTEEVISNDELFSIQHQLISNNEENKQIEEVNKVHENTPKLYVPNDSQSKPITNPIVMQEPLKTSEVDNKQEVLKSLPVQKKSPIESSPFDEETEQSPKKGPILEILDTAEYVEEVSNKKIEIDTSDDFISGAIPESILNGGLDIETPSDDEPSDDDIPDFEEPDDIDFA